MASSRCVTPNHGLLFIACSATLGLHPEDHFRALCPITRDEQVCVLDSDVDGSPCSPKHFFVWNPPCLGKFNYVELKDFNKSVGETNTHK